jgi:hypothetical protein
MVNPPYIMRRTEGFWKRGPDGLYRHAHTIPAFMAKGGPGHELEIMSFRSVRAGEWGGGRLATAVLFGTLNAVDLGPHLL